MLDLSPFNPKPICPKCLYDRTTFRYMEELSVVRAPSGEYISTGTYGKSPVPNLRVTCDRCGYQWTMQCADEKTEVPPGDRLCRCGHRLTQHAISMYGNREDCSGCMCRTFKPRPENSGAETL